MNEDPDQTPRSAASDLGLHCLPVSQKWDARLIWVNLFYDYANFSSKMQIEQVSSQNNDSDDDPLALTLRSMCFRSASQTLLASLSSAPFLMRQRHFARPCAI